MNQALCGKFDTHFVTAAYVFVDMEKKTIDYAGAGHPPLVLGRGCAGSAREVQQNGLFLGMFPQAKYSAVQVSLGDGERVVVYTDGVTESRSPSHEEFGTERLKQLLESSPALGADPFADGLLHELSRWSGKGGDESQDDDITILVIHSSRHGRA